MKIKRRTIVLLKKWTVGVAVLIIIFGGVYIYTQSTLFNIISYDIRGVDDITRANLDKDLHLLANKKTYLVLPNDKILTYSHNSIVSAVENLVPDISKVETSISGMHTLKVEITLLTPLFRNVDDKVVTEDGIVFITKKDTEIYPRIIISSSTLKNIKRNGLNFVQLFENDNVIDKNFLANVNEMSSKISSIIFPVETIIVDPSGDITFLSISGKSKVLILRDMDTAKVWSSLVSAVDTDPLKSKLATDKDELEYLDARYSNKVFYRFSDMSFQNNSNTAIMGSHATTTFSTSTISQ